MQSCNIAVSPDRRMAVALEAIECIHIKDLCGQIYMRSGQIISIGVPEAVYLLEAWVSEKEKSNEPD
jgi:hypothetical protein